MTTVFISYSHDSDAHRDFVRGIADRLRKDGVDCLIDQYINGFPAEGWSRWMENQIEAADFVLLICTETYLRRYRGQEAEGGKGVNFESMVISQTLYDHYYKNTKFIPVIPDGGSLDHVPVPLKAYSTYRLNTQYDDVYRILTGQAEYVQPPLGEVRQLPAIQPSRKIISDDLPTVEGELFGRKDELALLNDALDCISPHPNPSPQSAVSRNVRGRGARPHIVQFVASGGTGKTKLIRHWLDENNDKIEALIAWSFYSQGSGEDKQISATPFFMQALKSLGSDKSVSDFHTEEEKGEYIADLLREKRCLLVLDGLEPLQQVGRGMRGELKDRAIRKMLRCLVGGHSSLCIITTRLPVHELKGRRQLVQHDLQNLAPEDGVALLRSFGVSGRDVDMLAAVEEYGRHALALHLLGNALATYLDGDVRKRDTLTELIGDYDDVERHAFKVMQAYEHWLGGTPELKLLYLLGLFDHPVEQKVLEVLWDVEIPGLTDGVSKKAWLVAQRNLTQKYQMMSKYEGQDDLFDCHPLIRGYFGRQLKESQDEVWRQAHTVLYEHYKGLPEKLWEKYLPDTLEEMQPLFRAVVHGCAASIPEVLRDVFVPRIRRHEYFYSWRSLGAYNEELSVLAAFFEDLWATPNKDLPIYVRSAVLSWTGMCLHSRGRLHEALEATEAGLHLNRIDIDALNTAVAANNQAQIYTALGQLNKAEQSYGYAVSNAVEAESNEWIAISTASKADCLLKKGEYALAFAEFKQSEQKRLALEKSKSIRKKTLPSYIYTDILLNKFNTTIELLKLVRKIRSTLDLVQNSLGRGQGLIDLGSAQLALGRTYLKLAGLSKSNKSRSFYVGKSKYWVEKSIKAYQKSGNLDFLVNGLITYALVLRCLNHFKVSVDILNEIYEIAEPSGMRLHLTDYHLEMARLILAIEAEPTQYPEATPDREQRIFPFADQEEPGILTLECHIAEAARLIEETGYHRRDAELAELQKQVGTTT